MGLLLSCSENISNLENSPKKDFLQFKTIDEFNSEMKKIAALTTDEYLDWEAETFEKQTMYGDYLRALNASYEVQSLEDYYQFIETWKHKVRYSDLEVVDYFEVYPLIDAPRAYLPLISTDNIFIVDNVVFEFFDHNYIVYPNEIEFEKSDLINLQTKSEDLEKSIFAFPYNSNITTRANHQTCIQSMDNGGIWCYARRTKGIYNYDILFPQEFVEVGKQH